MPPEEKNKEELGPEVVAVESQDDSDEPAAPPSPRSGQPAVPTDKPKTTEPAPPAELPIIDDDLPVHHTQIITGMAKKEFWLKRALKSKKFWFTFILLLILGSALAWFIRPSRLYAVNLLGLKTDISVRTVTLAEEGQESATVKAAEIKINGQTHTTDEEGDLQLKVPYGQTRIEASKAGYESATHEVLLDIDPFFYYLGGKEQDEAAREIQLQLKPVGLPVVFKAVDWLTDGPIVSGAFIVGDIETKPDDQGLVKLRVPATEAKTVKVKSKLNGKYIDQEFELKIQEDPVQEHKFVPAGRHYFVSKRSGQLAVYSSNIDGSDVVDIVPASDKESSNIAFTVSPSGKYAVLASTRDGKRDARNQVLQKLYLVDLTTKKLTAFDEGSYFQFADWSGDTFVYSVVLSDSANNSSQRLSSYDALATRRLDLSTAQFFADTRVVVGNVAYSGSYNGTTELRVNTVKGGAEKTLGTRITQLSQVDVDKIAYQTSDNKWHEYNFNNGRAADISAPANSTRSILSTTSPDGQQRLIFDTIDGKATIILKEVASGKEKQLYAAGGVSGPMRWVGDVLVFRIVTPQQSADYAIPIKGGEPKKITDVTNTQSASQFSNPFYY